MQKFTIDYTVEGMKNVPSSLTIEAKDESDAKFVATQEFEKIWPGKKVEIQSVKTARIPNEDIFNPKEQP